MAFCVSVVIHAPLYPWQTLGRSAPIGGSPCQYASCGTLGTSGPCAAQPSAEVEGGGGGGRIGHTSSVSTKHVFPKLILDHSGCSNKCFWPILSPW